MQQPSGPMVTKVDAALVSLRARILDLHARTSELRDLSCMLRDGFGQGRNAVWPQFLDKYDTIAKLYSLVTEELDRAVVETGLENFSAIPCALTQDPGALPDLLRTKLEPEVERELKELQKGYEKGRNTLPIGKRIAVYNELIDGFLDEFQELRDSLAQPRPAEPPEPQVPQNAEIVLQAISNGTGLR